MNKFRTTFTLFLVIALINIISISADTLENRSDHDIWVGLFYCMESKDEPVSISIKKNQTIDLKCPTWKSIESFALYDKDDKFMYSSAVTPYRDFHLYHFVINKDGSVNKLRYNPRKKI